MKNPSSGGSELYTHEIFSRLAKVFGHHITLFTASFDGAETTEEVGGINIVRSGGRFSVYRDAKRYYNQHSNEYQVVIDEINTRPFLTPAFVRDRPIIAIIHQLAREYWWYETPFPVSAIGYYILEKRWLNNYRDIPTVTVSNSTLNDLKRLGFTRLTVVPNGLSLHPLQSMPKKSESFTAVFVARMSKVKRPEDAIAAFNRASLGADAKLFMVGDGQLLSRLSTKYSASSNVLFRGRVSEEEKAHLMREAHVHLAPYLREGWGNTVIEAAALGTPSIGYATSGLVDSILDGKTGLLVPRFDVDSLSQKLQFVKDHPEDRLQLALNGFDWARQFSWDTSASKFHALIQEVLSHSND